MLMLLPASTHTEALQLPRAGDLTRVAAASLESHFHRALRGAEDVVGGGGAPRQIVYTGLCREDEGAATRGQVVRWRPRLRDAMGEAVCLLEARVASALVDALLGSAAATDRDGLIELDCAILGEWGAALARRLLGPVLDPGTRGALQAEAGGGGFVPEPGEAWAGALFQLRTCGVAGRLVLWLPVVAALRLGASAAHGSRSRARLAEQLSGSRADVQARLITTTLSVAELRGLQPGDVLVLDMAPEDGAELLVNGRSKFVGKAGFMDGRLAFEVGGRSDATGA